MVIGVAWATGVVTSIVAGTSGADMGIMKDGADTVAGPEPTEFVAWTLM